MDTDAKKIEIHDRFFKLAVILIAGIIIFGASKIYFNFRNLQGNYPREITVSAEGKAAVKPDIALIKIGVASEGAKIEKIIKENTDKVNAILKEIKDAGVAEKDLETVNYNLSPRYEWTDKGQRISKGYALNQDIKVKIRDFEKVGIILEKSASSGANLIGDLAFTVDDPEAIREQAVEQAIAKAKTKAALIAEKSGLRLGRVTNVYEDYYSSPVAYESKMMSAEGIGGMGGGVSAAPEIQPGQQEVTVRVNLVYQVK